MHTDEKPYYYQYKGIMTWVTNWYFNILMEYKMQKVGMEMGEGRKDDD